MSKDTIVIIDYGSGNLRSAAKAFEHVIAREGLNSDVLVSGDPDVVRKASRIILPGQGAFADCMQGLSSILGMIEAIEERVLRQAVPFLGICVGMQLLATQGHEHGIHKGLNWIEGDVVAIEPDNKALKVPHMGWNEVLLNDSDHPVLQGIIKSTKITPIHFYFVHSFMFQCKDSQHELGYANYGGHIGAIVGRDNIVGVQFHPEKSQDAGLQLLSDFLHWKP